MKIYNYELVQFVEFLFKLKLIGKESRMRSRLVSLLSEKIKLFQDEYAQMIDINVEKDEEGKPIKMMIGDSEGYKPKDLVKFNKERMELMNEEVIIEENIERKSMLISVRDSILRLEEDAYFEAEEAVQFDRWCEIMEQINYEN